jgi:hypothetical protein
VAKCHAIHSAHQRTLAVDMLSAALRHLSTLSDAAHAMVTNTSRVPALCYQYEHCFVRYFLVRISIAKCFTDKRKRFRSEVMFVNKHVLRLNKLGRVAA